MLACVRVEDTLVLGTTQGLATVRDGTVVTCEGLHTPVHLLQVDCTLHSNYGYMTIFPLCAAHSQPPAAPPWHGGRWAPVPAGQPPLQVRVVRRRPAGAWGSPRHYPVSHLLMQRELSGRNTEENKDFDALEVYMCLNIVLEYVIQVFLINTNNWIQDPVKFKRNVWAIHRWRGV